jgi:hypothetical protein
MTTIEGQLAVLGGAATRPQGDTEVIHCLYDVSQKTIEGIGTRHLVETARSGVA